MVPLTQVLVDMDIPGVPQPQGSSRAFVRGGRPIITTDNPKLHQWRDRVALGIRAQRVGQGLYLGPVAVNAEFRFQRPASRPARRYPHHITRPDADKLIRAVGDSLSGVLLHDDAAVVRWHVAKRYAEPTETPGVRLRVEAV